MNRTMKFLIIIVALLIIKMSKSEDCPSGANCIRWCCESGQVYKMKKCMPSDNVTISNPMIYDVTKYKHKTALQMLNLNKIYGRMKCDTKKFAVILAFIPNSSFYLQLDGSVVIDISNKPRRNLKSDEYCIGTFLYQQRPIDSVMICYSDVDERQNYLPSIIVLSISVLFLIPTIVLYFVLPKHRSLNGLVSRSYLISLTLAFLCLLITQVLLTFDPPDIKYCLILTFMVYYSFMSCFCWMNVMSYDIWKTFRIHNGIPRPIRTVRVRFAYYCAYAYLVPLALTILTISMEFADNLPESARPNLRRRFKCFLDGKPKEYYLYTPMLILCICNSIFFILSIYNIYKFNKGTSAAKESRSINGNVTRDKKRLLVFLKLSVIMGVYWILEYFSFLYEKSSSFWKVIDMLNLLLGLQIFFIFAGRTSWQLLKKWLNKLRGNECEIPTTSCSSRSNVTTVTCKSTADEFNNIKTII